MMSGSLALRHVDRRIVDAKGRRRGSLITADEEIVVVHAGIAERALLRAGQSSLRTRSTLPSL